MAEMLDWSEDSSDDVSTTGSEESEIDTDWSPNLKDFMQKLRPELLNLMNEFADAEMFLIDGDSLFVELLLNKNLDWSHGGQFLHLVYLCERYLDLFQRKGGVFEIVFFQDYQELWRQIPSLNLARQVLKIHLSQNTKTKVLCDFKHPWDEAFVKYVKQFCPSFILLSDGHVTKLFKQRHIPEMFSKVFLCQLNRCLRMGINCAFTAGIEFCTSTLNGYHVTSHPRMFCLLLPKDRILSDVICSSTSNQSVLAQYKEILDEIIQASDNPLECQQQDDRVLLYARAAAVYLTQISDTSDPHHQDVIRVVLLHAVLLTEVPLSYRALSLNDNHIEGHSYLREELMRCFTEFQGYMSDFLELPSDVLNWSTVGICDVWDGRLLFALLDIILLKKHRNEDISLSERTRSMFLAVVNSASSLSNVEIDPFPIFQTRFYTEQDVAGQVRAKTASSLEGLVRMECPLLTEYAGEIIDTPLVRQLGQDEPDIAGLVVSGSDFDEIYHWHSGKPLSDDYERTKEDRKNEEDKKRAMRSQGKFATFMHRYGESLQGECCAKPIVVESNTSKSGKKGKNKTSAKALAIIEENKKKKREETAKEDKRMWPQQEKHMKSLIVEEEYEKALDVVENIIKRSSFDDVIIKALLMKVQILWKKWQATRGKTVDAVGACFNVIRQLVEDYGENLKAGQKEELATYLEGLGFGDIAAKTKLSKKSSQQASECSLNVSSCRFQLQNIGHHLKRETREDPDPRVDGFIPETWQRALLDAVDNKQSALIVAPTSSGKTYASFYCMERVLKEDNEGVVVYVSPTKALVNQVAATCYARFHKKVMPPGKSVYGVFTRDYRTNALNSQILITVPQCLEILVLSPARQDWVAKIKYVIFDEVHCIGADIGAEYWEHLLLLIRCPFLALSATIRNPEDLHTWLQNAEFQKRELDAKNKGSGFRRSRKSYEVAMVTHNQRHNDLEKFEFVRAKKTRNKDVPSGSLHHVHPCSMLRYHQLVQCAGTFPSQISLSPRETLALYDAMLERWPDKGILLQELNPEKYFAEKAFISKQDVRAYEEDLKKEFVTWTSHRERVEQVIASLQGDNVAPANRAPPDDDYVLGCFFLLLEQLEKSDKLPVIFFSFDRKLCENLASKTVEYLEEKEDKIKARKLLPAVARAVEKRAQKKAKIEKRLRDREDEEGGGKSKTKCFLFDDPTEKGCSFAVPGVLDDEDAEMIVRSVNNAPSQFKAGLRRGVGYHHAGMSAKMRRVVEMLFRKKFLRVVFATGTLALGIHMPCKTVVFAGDSVFLNSLQFHQISGRAGRRGFDLLGDVIFLGIPQAKIQRLMTVSLPRIIGNFPLNVTLVLRLLLLVNKGGDTQTTMNQVVTMLKNPLICQYQPKLDLQLKHHFLFSTEMLVRQGLLDVKGNPQGLAGLATHLHYHEPANLVFISFLKQGLFHKFCKRGRSKGGKFSKDFLKSLAVVLSHLFAIRHLHPYTLLQPRSTSKVLLEPLPHEFHQALVKYNSNVHNVFDLYLRTVAVHIYDTMGEDVVLPLSNVKLISVESYEGSASVAVDGERSAEGVVNLCEELQAMSSPVKACSAFAALSGNTDNRLYSTVDLISNIRYQVYTDVKVIPILHKSPKAMLNAYAVDFYNHGNKAAIISENCLKTGDAFKYLKDFLLAVQSIYISLTELAPANDVVVAAFAQLAQEYNEVFYTAFGHSAL